MTVLTSVFLALRAEWFWILRLPTQTDRQTDKERNRKKERNMTDRDTNHARRAPLAQCAAVGQVQARHHDAPLSTQLCSPVPLWLLHPGRECCRSQSTTIRQPPSSCRSPLQHEHVRPSGLLCHWSSLPDKLRNPSLSIDSFRRQLKTFLFVD